MKKKPKAEFIEGPEAANKFEEALQKILSVPPKKLKEIKAADKAKKAKKKGH